MTYGLEIKKKVFHGNDCEKVVDVLDNEIERYVRYSWKNDELTVWRQSLDELKEQDAYEIYDKLDEIGIACEIYEEDEDDYDLEWEKTIEFVNRDINRLIKIR